MRSTLGRKDILTRSFCQDRNAAHQPRRRFAVSRVRGCATLAVMNVLDILSLAGVAVFAISGALTAGRKSFDVFGVLVIAIVTAIGGGTIRDLLLDRPVFWTEDRRYLWVTVSAALLTLLYVRVKRPPMRLLLIADALGLALFTISGTQIAEGAGASPSVAILMGGITGVAGGVLRDVLSAEVPMLLRDGELYATAALAGAIAYFALARYTEIDRPHAALIGMATVALVRFAALRWSIRLPVVRLDDDHRPSGFLPVLLLTTALVSSASCSRQAPAPLVVGMDLASPPFEMKDAKDRPAGFSVDLAKAMAAYLGRPLKIEQTRFDDLIPALRDGRIDLILSSMADTEERRQLIDFSQPYLSVTRADSATAGHETWAIGVRKGNDALLADANRFLAAFRSANAFEGLADMHLGDRKSDFAF